MVMFELLLVSLAAHRSIQVYRTRRDAGDAPNLLVILMRDSIMYFVGVVVIIMTNLIIWAISPVRPLPLMSFVFLIRPGN